MFDPDTGLEGFCEDHRDDMRGPACKWCDMEIGGEG